MSKILKRTTWSVLTVFIFLAPLQIMSQEHSVARIWNEEVLHAIRNDFARPTVHSRNLFHISVAMYDAWAVYDSVATTFFLGKSLGGFECPLDSFPMPQNIPAARKEAISHAVYNIIYSRFRRSPGGYEILTSIDTVMQNLGYDPFNTSTDYQSGSPASLGNYIAQKLLEFGKQDGSNESNDYANQYYSPINPPLIMKLAGNPDIVDFNHWQPLTLDIFIDQAGNPIPFNTPDFLGPEWGNVVPFALTEEDLTIHQRDSFEYWVYHDPGAPPHLQMDGLGNSAAYKWGNELVSIWGSHLDPADSVFWDISPASFGNNPDLPISIDGYPEFYDLYLGGDASQGYALNPYTGQPYEPQIVPRADYARVLAEFWADGPDSETPPGHWFTIVNYVNDHPALVKKFMGIGPVLDDLEWDVKVYFLLGGTMHDAAVSAWGVKGWYDYIRPVSAIRGLAELGQSSDSTLPSYHPAGITLHEGLIELVTPADTALGFQLADTNEIKLYTWRGPNFINNPATDVAGVGWILADHFWPYQRPSFVTPPFAGYVSGHSTFSRAAAELMTLITGDPFFPGGMSRFVAKKNEFLVFEDGPSVDVVLQWATYRDASDQTSLSRLWGGIHPPADDIPGRIIGQKIGVRAFEFALPYFGEVVNNTQEKKSNLIQARLFPNPARDYLQIEGDYFGNTQIRIFSTDGRLLRKFKRFMDNKVNIPLNGMLRGTYLVELRNGSDQLLFTGRLVKQ